MPKLKLKVADYFIVGLILLTGAAGFWFNLQEAGAVEHKYAVIYLENEKVAELSLATNDSFEYTLKFGEDDRHAATVEVKDGRVRMLPIDEELCPKGICTHTGWISHSYESIVCLPNQIMVVFAESPAGAGANDIDGVTY